MSKVLQQLAKGAGLLFAGTLLTYIIKFFYRIIASRYLGPADYGLLSLADGVLNIILLVALLGLSSGTVRFISHNLGKGSLEKVKGTISSTLQTIIPLSIVVTIIVIVFSQYIGIGIFNKKELVPIIVIFTLALPFFALTNIFSSIFIAFNKIQYRNYLNALLRPISLLLLTGLAIFLKGTVYHFALAILISHILPALLGFYLLEFKTFSLIRSKIKAVYDYKTLFSFSLPLFFSGIFIMIMGWMDTFFLGALKTAADVGIYNVALPLVSTLIIFISAFGNIFLPISAELKAKEKYGQIASLYSSVTRWMFLLSFPLFVFCLIFAKDIIRILFGSAYESGAIALQILLIAYLIKALIGPASKTLMVFNKTKILFYVNSSAAIINFILNYLLISKYSFVGAALATALSLFFRDGITFLLARKKLPFNYNHLLYLKYTLSTLLPFLGISLLIKQYLVINLSALLLVAFSCSLLYVFLLIVFRSFHSEDLMIIEALEKKLGISLKIIKKWIK